MTDQPTAWMPIATAPQDGVRIWAWFPYKREAFAVRWDRNAYEAAPNWTLDDGESAALSYDPPSHWQMLPGPPAFTCPTCGRVSYHPRDLAESYCGVCGFADSPATKNDKIAS